MTTEAPRAVRLIGLLLLVQLANLIVPFVLLQPALGRDVLVSAAPHASAMTMAVTLLYINGAVTVAVSLLLWPHIRQHSEAAGLLLVAAGAVWLTLQVIDNAHLLSLLALSQRAAEGGAGADLLPAATAAVQSTRRFVHYSTLIGIDAWLLVLFATCARFRLVPRAIGVLGIGTVLLHLGGMVLPLFQGRPPMTLLGASMGVMQLAVAGWVMVKGLPVATRR
ncbi:MAG TPA: DUF4386 family protein [Gemmatimonadales bacterium]|nr:DUF4386 family protein [Gemmatimonadales bacterium]